MRAEGHMPLWHIFNNRGYIWSKSIPGCFLNDKDVFTPLEKQVSYERYFKQGTIKKKEETFRNQVLRKEPGRRNNCVGVK